MKLIEIELPPDVVLRAQRGERAALGAFYAAFSRAAYTLIRRIVPGPAADDILQEAFIDAFRGLPRFEGSAPLGAWLRSVVVRRCLMHLRSPWQRSREFVGDLIERLEADAGSPPGLALDLGRALESLPALSRLVVWLHDVEGYTHEEIAAATGKTASFSKSQLARAHARLRHVLNAEPPLRSDRTANDCVRSPVP